jgi:hypothetical protein
VVLTPHRPGRQGIGALSGSLVLNPRDPFDWFFRRSAPQSVTLELPRHELQVLPLPTNNVPASFNGAGGQFELTASAGPTNVAVGDPITVKVQISGRGAREWLSLPDQPVDGFYVYSATARLETTDALGIQGKLYFELVLAPQSATFKHCRHWSSAFLIRNSVGIARCRLPPRRSSFGPRRRPRRSLPRPNRAGPRRRRRRRTLWGSNNGWARWPRSNRPSRGNRGSGA